jgi:cell division protein FtsZ
MMKMAADGVICIPNDQLLILAGEETSVLDAFRPTDDFLSQGVRKIWQLLARTGLINIDFADLRAVLKRKNGETLFGFGEGSGKKKLEEALEIALGSPLLQDHPTLSQATAALIGVTHGPDFTMSQLKRLMEGVHQRIGPQTACKQGIVVDEAYSDRVTLVVIASTGEPILGEENDAKPSVKPEGSSPSSHKEGVREKKASLHSRKSTGHGTDLTENSSLTPRPGGRKKLEKTEAKVETPKQETLKLIDSTRGLFEHVERTILNGEDLDRPTFIRRGFKVSDLK